MSSFVSKMEGEDSESDQGKYDEVRNDMNSLIKICSAFCKDHPKE